MLYGDDVEINNSLGSHKDVSKIYTLYCTLRAIPPEYSSLLGNISNFKFICQSLGNKYNLLSHINLL